MRIVFTTDLHGATWKYDKLYKVAQAYHADVVINGGDMLPNNGNLFQQDRFITRQLQQHFRQFDGAKIHYLCYLGNDDLMIFDPVFEETSQQYEYIHNMAQRKITLHDIDFIGMNWVVDYPFRLKDRCRMDTREYVFQPQLGSGLLSTPSGWKKINDWHAYANTLPTIEDELRRLPQPQHMQRSVYIIHMPPAYVGLDVCGHGEKVGSKALFQFFCDNQPKLSLHGHIHESPDVSGIWNAHIGETLCVQPGQMADFTYVTIDMTTMDIHRYTISLRDDDPAIRPPWREAR